MTNVIVCTTINEPTTAIESYDAKEGWTLVVVGDRKTPANYSLRNGIFISADDQEKIAPKLSELIGWNCIQRRNFGFLIAHQMGAEFICTVDDDNIPLENWGQDVNLSGPVTLTEYKVKTSAFDPIGVTNYPHLWHRGFPLQLIPQRDYRDYESVTITPTVQADFWNGDPDIDAICRMEHAPECTFDEAAFPFTSNVPGPFNSQNTFLHKSVFPDYFLFPFVGRMDDIWAAYYLQSLGHRVVYCKPSVYQARNPHDLVVDMKNEYLGYENNLQLIAALKDRPQAIEEFLPERSIAAWNAYRDFFE